MALIESDREDLIREATALVRRAELKLPNSDRLVTVGYRSNGAFSVFFDQDPVYQFDLEGLLRRAYVDGHLYRSQHSTLAQMRRERTDQQTLLIRTDLNEVQLPEFRRRMLQEVERLARFIAAGQVEVLRHIPDDFCVQSDVLQTLSMILQNDGHWLSTSIRARK